MPEVSVVCSTYQRSHRLPAFFAALEAQTFDRSKFEVVIVNNGSTDDTSAVLERLAAASSLTVRSVTLDRNQGASGGRNAAWRAARAPIVAFTDDDCSADPAWLTAGVAVLGQTGAAIVVGRTEANPAQLDNRGPFSRSPTVNEEGGKRYLPTCNIFYRRADLEAVDGFDPRFATKGGEDTDLGWRVLDRGGSVEFAQDALVLHDVGVSSFRSALREAATWIDIPLVNKLHPKRTRPILVHGLFWKKSHELILLSLVGVGVATIAVALGRPVGLLGLLVGLPWVRYRIQHWPAAGVRRPTRVTLLPHAFLIDFVECTTMIRGSIKNHTIVL